MPGIMYHPPFCLNFGFSTFLGRGLYNNKAKKANLALDFRNFGVIMKKVTKKQKKILTFIVKSCKVSSVVN